MPRTLRMFLPLTGEPVALATAFSSDPERWLPDAQRAGPDRWTTTARAGAMARTVTATVGGPWRAGSTYWRTLSWQPESESGDAVPIERMLPSLDAEIGLHVEPGGRVTVVLDARYDPPGGVLGTAIDAVALGRVAQSTAERFLRDVAARLTAASLLVGDGATVSGSARTGDAPDEGRPATVTT